MTNLDPCLANVRLLVLALYEHRHDHEHMPDGTLVENGAGPNNSGEDANSIRKAENGVEINA